MFTPIYPKDAIKGNIEGHCMISFDLKDIGSLAKPYNFKILNCTPENVFERNCVDAVSKWRFKSVSELKKPHVGLVHTCKFKFD